MKKTIYLAGGCYWGVEAYMKRIDGVVDTDVGFANGDEGLVNPTYAQVCSHTTGFAETVRLVYDDEVVTLDYLLDRFMRIIDPTLLNRQGPDIGSQYRTGIYFEAGDTAAEKAAHAALDRVRGNYTRPIVTEVEPMRSYYSAEESHQDYLDKNPNGYCHIDLNK